MAKKIIRDIEIKRATRKFTDREEPRKVFWNRFNKMKENITDINSVNVITYYGIGGIGKSSLLRKIIEELEQNAELEKIKKPYYLFFNFEDSQEPSVILSMMKNKLQSDYDFKFLRFDFAMYIHALKIGKNVDKPEVKSIIENSDLLKAIVEVTGEIPVLDNFSKMAKVVDFLFTKVKSKFNNKHKDFIENIKNESPETISKNLAKYFAQDLAENLEEIDRPFVILLDTYEKMVNEMNDVGYVLTKDLWLRGDNGLILNVPKVLWVIAGREMIKWGKNDSDWDETLEQHRLGDLSFNDAEVFLREAGIEEENIIKQIYNITSGTPLYLDLCLSTYEDIKNAGEKVTVDKFGDTKEELIERYIKYMNIQTRECVYILAQIGIWTDELIKDMAHKIIPNFSMEQYEIIKELSFVFKDEENNYCIHKTVRRILNKICPHNIFESYINGMREYLITRFNDINYFFDKKIYSDYLNKIYELEEKILNKENVDEIIERLYSIERKHGYNVTSIIPIRYYFYLKVFDKDDDKVLKVTGEMAYYYKEREEFEIAIEFAVMAMERIRENFDYDNEHHLELYMSYLVAYYDRYFKKDIKDCFETSLVIYSYCLDKYGEKNKYTIKALFLCYLFIHDEIKIDSNKWIIYAKKLAENCRAVFGDNYILEVEKELNLQGCIDFEFEEIEELIKYEKLVEKYALENNVDKEIETLYYIAEIYKSMERKYYIDFKNEIVKALFKIMDINKQKYSEDNINRAEVLYYLSNLYYRKNSYEELLYVNMDIYNILIKYYGKETEKTIDVLFKIFKSYYYLEKYETVIEKGLELCEKIKEVYGEECVELLYVYNILSNTYYDLGMNNEQNNIENKAYKICLEKFGELYFFRLSYIFQFEFLRDAKDNLEIFEGDVLLYDAMDYVLEQGKVTPSLLQRKFKLGYARASRLVDQLVKKGVIDGTSSEIVKKVIITKEKVEKMKKENMNFKNENKIHEKTFINLEKSNFADFNYIVDSKLEKKRNKENLLRAIEILFERTEISTTLIQRNLRIGYYAAVHIINTMEEMRIISAYNGSAPRVPIITKDEWEEMRKTDKIRIIIENG